MTNVAPLAAWNCACKVEKTTKPPLASADPPDSMPEWGCFQGVVVRVRWKCRKFVNVVRYSRSALVDSLIE